LDSKTEEGSHLKKKYTIGRIIEAASAMGFQKRGSNYFLWVGGSLLAAGMAFFAFEFLRTTMAMFAWLLYGTIILAIVWAICAIFWRIQDAIKYLDKEQQDEP
jgi:hypothetical protein